MTMKINWKSIRPCRRVAAGLARYSEDPALLGDGERRAVEAHLAQCPACREQYETVRRIGAVLRANVPPAAEPAPDLWSRLEAQIQAEAPPVAAPARLSERPMPAPVRRPSPLRWPAFVPAAALAGVAMAGALILNHGGGSSSSSGGSAPLSSASDTTALRQAGTALPAAGLPALPTPSAQTTVADASALSTAAARKSAAASIAGEGGHDSVAGRPRRSRRPAAPSEASINAARRAAQEARLAAGLGGSDGRENRKIADPFRSGGAAAAARTVAARTPTPAASPRATLGTPSVAEAEPRMLALADRPSSPIARLAREDGSEVSLESTPASLAPDAGAAGGSVAAAITSARPSSVKPGPGRPVTGAGGVTGEEAVRIARGGSSSGAGLIAASVSPTEAVSLHSRQRNLFLNYGSAKVRDDGGSR